MTLISQSPNFPIPQSLSTLEARFDRWEPLIFATVPEQRRWERVAAEAAALATRWPDPADRPPLFGVPVGVKDIFHVAGLPTRAGSQLPAELLTGPESAAVTALRAAGALIVAKTVTTEFAWFGPGPTRNPHNPFHTPGGSSSGSAAAVAAGLCTLALGSQTIGSVNRPAAYCGVIGYKPTYDRISKQNVIELARSHDHVGVLGRTVADVVIAAGVLCADWQGEPAGAARPRLAVPEGPYLRHVEADALAAFEATCDRLVQVGYSVRRVPAMPAFAEIRRQHMILLAADAAAYHAQFAAWHHLYHPRTRALIEEGARYGAPEIETAQRAKIDLRDYLAGLMREGGFDLWITPSAPGPAPEGHAGTGDPVLNLPFTNAGLPTLTVPSGRAANGLPLGIQLVAGWNQDEALLAAGRQIAADLATEVLL